MGPAVWDSGYSVIIDQVIFITVAPRIIARRCVIHIAWEVHAHPEG